MDGTGEAHTAVGKIEEVVEFIFLYFTTQKHSYEVANTAILSRTTRFFPYYKLKKVVEQ